METRECPLDWCAILDKEGKVTGELVTCSKERREKKKEEESLAHSDFLRSPISIIILIRMTTCPQTIVVHEPPLSPSLCLYVISVSIL